MPTQESATKSNNFEIVLRSAMEFPGIKINRADFLRKELSKYFDDSVVDKAIATNPAQAGIDIKALEPIAKSCVNFETTKVTAISAAAGVPGGFAMAATVPADLAQFFGHVIRVLQKLAYLYGWQEMFRSEQDGFDDETSNRLILFIGVMFGVNVANATISKIATLAAVQAEKVLLSKTLTKGTIYPIVKQVAKIIGVRMTKAIFAKGIGKAIPVLGAVASGTITFAFFKPMSTRLKKYLATLPMASVDFYKGLQTDDEIVEVDFSDIVVEDVEDSDMTGE